MDTEPIEQSPEKTAETPQAAGNPTTPADTSPGLKEILKPSEAKNELEERREPKVAGDLGMHLRVA